MTDPRTVIDLLDRAAASSVFGVRILDRRECDTWASWSEVRRTAQRVAGALQRIGIERGDRVALFFPTGRGFFDAFFGVLLAGAVPVPLYPPVRLGRLAEYNRRTVAMLRVVGARLVLADRTVRRLLGTVMEGARPELGCRALAGLPDSPSLQLAANDADLALIQFSSGTTVDPKPVALSHRAVVAQAVALNRFWPERSGRPDSGVSWLPLYHDMGLIGCVMPALERPADLTLIPPELFVVSPAVWLRTISRFGGTVSPAPNFAYGLCVDKIRDEELAGVDLSSWRVALNGAESVAPHVLREFQARFARWGFRPEALTPVYGLSEAALAVAFSDVDSPFTSSRFDRGELAGRGAAVPGENGLEIVSVGRPLPGFDLRVTDEDGCDREPAGVGRVLVRGPSLMDGYFGNPQVTASVLRDGWLDTGDLGFLFEGELYIVGRAKDVIILRGRNFAPEEVERAADEVTGVRKGCVVAGSFMPEEGSREILLVLAEARKDVELRDFRAIEREVARAVRAVTGLDPDKTVVVGPGTLPRTSSGKLRRCEALHRWRTGQLTAPQPVTSLRLLAAVAESSLAMLKASIGDRKNS